MNIRWLPTNEGWKRQRFAHRSARDTSKFSWYIPHRDDILQELYLPPILLPYMRYAISSIIVGILTITFLFAASADRFNPKADHIPTGENAKGALDRVATWATWLCGLQTAAMAAMGLLMKDVRPSKAQMTAGFYAVLFFGWSILVCTWVLGALASMQLELQSSASVANDIYHSRAFPQTSIRLWPLLGQNTPCAFSGLFSLPPSHLRRSQLLQKPPNLELSRSPRAQLGAQVAGGREDLLDGWTEPASGRQTCAWMCGVDPGRVATPGQIGDEERSWPAMGE